MLFGAMNNPSVDVYEEIEMIADMGFDFIDLTLEPDQTYSAVINVDKVARALEKASLKGVGHTAWYLPIASPFPEMRKVALEELERCLRVFRDLGFEKMNVHPQTRVPLHEEDWIVAQNVESLASLSDLAKTMNMRILLENTPHFSRVGQLKPILEAVPDLELLLDVGHSNVGQPFLRAEELLANFGDRLGHVHLSDNRGGPDDQHLPLGVGNINWLKVARLFKQIGYDGTATIEVFGDDDDYLMMSRDKFKRLLSGVQV